MNNILPIRSVVRLKNETQKNRGALFNHEGTIGYFDYSACLYRLGNEFLSGGIAGSRSS